jgi:hypothetical protein
MPSGADLLRELDAHDVHTLEAGISVGQGSGQGVYDLIVRDAGELLIQGLQREDHLLRASVWLAILNETIAHVQPSQMV